MDTRLTPIMDFARKHFGRAQPGDRWHREGLVSTARRLLEHRDGTLPHRLYDPKNLKELYRLVNTDEITHEAVWTGTRNGPGG
jgi:hypothetical protein